MSPPIVKKPARRQRLIDADDFEPASAWRPLRAAVLRHTRGEYATNFAYFPRRARAG